MNQSRCCAKDRGAGPAPWRRGMAGGLTAPPCSPRRRFLSASCCSSESAARFAAMSCTPDMHPSPPPQPAAPRVPLPARPSDGRRVPARDVFDDERLDDLRELRDRRRLKEALERELHPEGVPHPRDDLGADERVPAELGKEVVMHADGLHVEQLLP